MFAAAFLVLFLACYAGGALVWEDFTYYDNSHFTNETLQGRNIPVQISPQTGRFWPLGYQEFNLWRHFTSSISGYHALRLVQLVLLCGILLVFDEDLSTESRVGLIALALITPSILISFGGLIYAEANVVLLLVCLARCLKRFEQTGATLWAVAALVCSQLLLYYKETSFLLVFGLSAGRLLLRCWKVESGRWGFKRLRSAESRLDICLAVMVVPFLLYYLAAMFPNYRAGYMNDARLPLTTVLASYSKLDLLAWIFAVVVLARIFLIWRRKAVPSPLWDGLALAGMSCLAGYLALRMYTAYYLAPVDLIAVLYVGRLAILSWGRMSAGLKLCEVALLAIVLLQNASFSAFRVYERKNVVHAKAELGHAIKTRYESDPQDVKRLFFPFTNPFQMLEFASYLNYVGVPVESQGRPAGPGVTMAGPAIKKDGPCGYRTFICHSANQPDPGDLVVTLPDDPAHADGLGSYLQEGGSPLVAYEPRPAVPRWLRPFVDHLHVVSPVFSQSHLPDSWLNASVAVWK